MQSASDDPRSEFLPFGPGLGQRAMFGDERVKPPARVTGAFPKTSRVVREAQAPASRHLVPVVTRPSIPSAARPENHLWHGYQLSSTYDRVGAPDKFESRHEMDRRPPCYGGLIFKESRARASAAYGTVEGEIRIDEDLA
jgi:hypothetical protein